MAAAAGSRGGGGPCAPPRRWRPVRPLASHGGGQLSEIRWERRDERYRDEKDERMRDGRDEWTGT